MRVVLGITGLKVQAELGYQATQWCNRSPRVGSTDWITPDNLACHLVWSTLLQCRWEIKASRLQLAAKKNVAKGNRFIDHHMPDFTTIQGAGHFWWAADRARNWMKLRASSKVIWTSHLSCCNPIVSLLPCLFLPKPLRLLGVIFRDGSCLSCRYPPPFHDWAAAVRMLEALLPHTDYVPWMLFQSSLVLEVCTISDPFCTSVFTF